MSKFERAPREVSELSERIISADYPDLCELMTISTMSCPALVIDYVFVHADTDEDGNPKAPAIKLHGYPCYGLCRVINLRDRAMGRGDVEIQLDASAWGDFDDPEREALLAHEIHHINPKKDAEGAVVRDDLGRVVVTMRKHDHEVGWFTAIAKRYGRHSIEVRQARQIFDRDGYAYFPFMKLGDKAAA